MEQIILSYHTLYPSQNENIQQIENFFARNPRQLISLNFFWKMWDCWQPCMPMDCSLKF